MDSFVGAETYCRDAEEYRDAGRVGVNPLTRYSIADRLYDIARPMCWLTPIVIGRRRKQYRVALVEQQSGKRLNGIAFLWPAQAAARGILPALLWNEASQGDGIEGCNTCGAYLGVAVINTGRACGDAKLAFGGGQRPFRFMHRERMVGGEAGTTIVVQNQMQRADHK